MAFVLLIVLHGAAPVPVYGFSESGCASAMNIVQRHLSPERIVLLACLPLGK